MIIVNWTHAAAQPRAYASLLPRTIEAIERWARVEGKMQQDAYGPYYDVLTVHPELVRHLVLRPATMKLGAQKVLEEGPSLWAEYENEIDQVFTALMSGRVSDPEFWSESALDLMVQMAWFREVMFS